jgi:PhnB protein
MSSSSGGPGSGIPPGWHAVTPRIVVANVPAFVAFLKHVFGASGEIETTRPSEVRIGDSLLLVSGPQVRETYRAFLYVYVHDVAGTYERALQAGAISLEPPWDTPYGDRRAMFKDPWENLWQVAMCRE